MKQAKPIIFFTDWALGKSVPLALREAGAVVEMHRDHFAPETPDTEWLPEVSARGWVVLTKDKAIGKNPLEVQAIARSNARVFTLVSGNLNTSNMVALFVAVLPKLEKMVIGNQAPFIAKVYRNHRVAIWRKRTQLIKQFR